MLEKEEIELIKQMSIMTHDLISEEGTLADIYNLQDALEVNILTDKSRPYILNVSGTPVNGKPEDNLIVKAYLLLKDTFQLPPIDIHLFKHIPMQAGLGGGSADCAFMIKLLNEKFSLGMNSEQMETYASQLGADCAFFIRNEPVFATGIGNVFEPITLSLSGYHIVLVKPEISVSTRDAFSGIIPAHPELSLKEIIQTPIETWKNTMKNDFENTVFRKYPELAAIKDKLYNSGAIYASMSGSGSTIYGIFKEAVKNVDELFNGYFCRQRTLE